MTRTSKIWLALSIGAVCVAVFATRPANAQSPDQGIPAEQDGAESAERPLLPIDLKSLHPDIDVGFPVSPISESAQSLTAVPRKVSIEEEEEQLLLGHQNDRRGCEHRKACENFYSSMPQEPLASCPDCPFCEGLVVENPELRRSPSGKECPGASELDMPETIPSQVVSPAVEWAAVATFREPCPAKESIQTGQRCEDLADNLANSLADPNISTESRREILAATMKLMVRNAELEARAEIASLKLEHQQELSQLRNQVAEFQTYATQIGEIKNWMAPIYANQNQTQRQFQTLTNDLQIINRTLRLLEQEKRSQQLLLTNQPRRATSIPPQVETNPYVRPERWSRLPSYEKQQQTVPSRPDHSTMRRTEPKRSQPTIIRASAPMDAPRRLNPQEIQQERVQTEIQQMQSRLNQLKSESKISESKIRQAGWNEPLPSQPIKPIPQMLRPRTEY